MEAQTSETMVRTLAEGILKGITKLPERRLLSFQRSIVCQDDRGVLCLLDPEL